MSVNKCIEALKDIYENIPEDERYASVLSVVGDRLTLEFDKLMPMALSSSTWRTSEYQRERSAKRSKNSLVKYNFFNFDFKPRIYVAS